MPRNDPDPGPASAPAKPLESVLKLLTRLWHGEQGATRFETRLGKLARHREEEHADAKSRVLKTTTTARWWRRFR